jgi:hypothetical protein
MSWSVASYGSGGEPTPEQLAWQQQMRSLFAGPAPNLVPVAWPFATVVGRSDSAAVFVTGALLYPTGLVFRLSAVVRHTSGDLWSDEVGGAPHRRTIDPLSRRFGVRYADGRTAETFADGSGFGPRLGQDPTALPDLDQPRFVHRGGHGDSTGWAEDLFLAPLPPDGPLELFCTWPRFGIEESRSSVDMTGAAAAVASVVELWPYEDEPEPAPFEPPRLGEPGPGFFRPILDDDLGSG